MYIKKIEITNIRCIDHFEMTFDHPAGWHVLIGDNGSGKSSILRSIALGLIGTDQILGLGRKSQWVDWSNWLRIRGNKGWILLDIVNDKEYDLFHLPVVGNAGQSISMTKDMENKYGVSFEKKFYPVVNENLIEVFPYFPQKTELNKNTINCSWNSRFGWFSVAFGPHRNFIGEDSKEDLKSQYAQLIGHVTLFDETASLIDIIAWIKQKKFQQLDGKNKQFDQIKELINSSKFLPYNAKLNEVSSERVTFVDGNGLEISIDELSDGFMSMIGLFFELLRQIFARYLHDIFSKNNEGEIFVNVPGVVLIDEIDAHLHPTWQTRIGQWFTKYFPNIQFIVTTHSPLICRACEKGSIWRLAAPGSEMESGEITGLQKDKLIYGNILDAYGTEVFGKSPVRSAQSNEKLARLGELSMLSALGKITDEEEKERIYLQKILSTDDPTGF